MTRFKLPRTWLFAAMAVTLTSLQLLSVDTPTSSAATPTPASLARVWSGGATFCGLSETSQAYCWGYNENGQVGNNSVADALQPAAVHGARTWQRLAMSYSTTCGVTNTSVAFCWGANWNGELGDGTTTNRSTPQPVSGSISWLTVQPGDGGTTCGLSLTGAAYCWGANDSGQVGDGTTTNRMTPALVSGNHVFRALTNGNGTACAIDVHDAAYCWGANWNGEAGVGDMDPRLVPTLVVGGRTWAMIESSGGHTCGITTASIALCWGRNGNGELGNSTYDDETSPSLISGSDTWKSIRVSLRNSCGITTGDVPKCWGTNTAYQLGDGTNGTRNTPTTVAALPTALDLIPGEESTCAITSSRTLTCWGSNWGGQLGDGTTTSTWPEAYSTVENPTAVEGNLNWLMLSTSTSNTTCGITTTHDAYCWGSNQYSQAGTDPNDPTDRPAPVVGSHKFVEIVQAGSFTCAIDEAAHPWCWGTGNLGDGNGNSSDVMTPVSTTTSVALHGLTPSTSYSATGMCALDSGNMRYCWGNTMGGNFGPTGVTMNYDVPTLAPEPGPYQSLAGGQLLGCGIDANDDGYCWGAGFHGNRGNGTEYGASYTSAISGSLKYRQLVTDGGYATCGLTTTYATYCWGANSNGQVGDNSGTDKWVPTPVAGNPTFHSLSGGGSSFCGLDTNGDPWCWGFDHATTPTKLTGLTHPAFTSLIHTNNRYCGLDAAGVAYCWGQNTNGATGVINHTSFHTTSVVGSTTWSMNSAPHFTDSAANTAQSIRTGHSAAALSAQDADGDTLPYSATSLPTGLSLSSAGTFTGAPSTPGTWTSVIRTRDEKGGDATTVLVFTITANTAPSFSPSATNTFQTVALGQTPERIDTTDADGDNVTISKQSGDISPGLALQPDGTFTGTTNALGTSWMTVAANDGAGGVSTTYLGIAVIPAQSILAGGAIGVTPTGAGYIVPTTNNDVRVSGDAKHFGSMKGKRLKAKIVGVRSTLSGNGYYQFASDGGVFTFGDAHFYGSMGGKKLRKPVVGMTLTPTGNGYWLVAKDGGVFAFGDAAFFGSLGTARNLPSEISAIAALPSGMGYWLVARNGGIYAFGNAQFLGTMGNKHIDGSVIAVASTPTGDGYYVISDVGGIFTFGDAVFVGAGRPGKAKLIGAVTNADGSGYQVVDTQGNARQF